MKIFITISLLLAGATLYGQNVGIGNATPKSKLDVSGGLTVGGTYGGVNAAPANGAIIEGNVGIGTPSPDGRLSVIGSVPGGELKLHLANTSTSGYSVIRFSESATGSGVAYLHRFNSAWATSGMWEPSSIGFYEAVGNMNIGGNAAFKVYTGGTGAGNERMRVTSGGNVGIGETNPAAMLDVNGNLILQNGVAVNEFSTDGGLTDNSNTALPTEQAVKTYVDTRITGTDDWTKTGNDIYNNNSGNVGIGNNNPAGYKLNVTGNLAMTGTGIINMEGTKNTTHGIEWIYGGNNSDRYGMAQASGGNVAFYTAANYAPSFFSFNLANASNTFDELVRIGHDGNIGIGTTSTTAGLNVAGNRYALFGPNSSWGAYLQVGGNGSVTTHASMAATNGNLHLDAASGGYGLYLNWYKGTDGVYFGNGASGGVGRMTNAGYFGIGTTGPGYPLNVVTTRSGDWQARFTNGAANVYLNHEHGYGMHINTGQGNSSGRYAMEVRNASQTHLYVRDDGYIGVGTISPGATLDVRGHTMVASTDANRMIKFTDGWTGYPDATWGGAEISNDVGTYKTLMLVGNKTSGVRKVSVWDRLEVNGSLYVSGGVQLNQPYCVVGYRWTGCPAGFYEVYIKWDTADVGNADQRHNDWAWDAGSSGSIQMKFCCR